MGERTESPDDLLTVREAAELLGISRARVEQLIQGGRLPAVRRGSMPRSPYRLRRADVQDALPGRRPVGRSASRPG